ncbi:MULTISPECIES: sigma-70 family RNA polymerase sigma factor [Bacillaceae]|uniref:RNA polymerase sigma factor n=1 Tax=Peribacillus huizhouensis TaxID=1501239 RepID=A0ABR6CSL4_9BACI|nr:MULTISPECIES: sigma-70 family RNA polymerase sigma factor [Bacillaceae]MBA9028015.1 RNA polymerase sigma-70 factor (ECF subfamily) [Peribacillus huizhouensis]
MVQDIRQLLITTITEKKENYYRLAYSYVKNKDDALDIIQESIKKALISVDKINDSQSINSWFYKIIVHTALDFLRKHKKVTLADVDTLEFFSQGHEDDYQNIDLQKAIDDLPVKYKSIIILRYFEDLKLEEIAIILGENINTIKTRLYKALELLRIKMD